MYDPSCRVSTCRYGYAVAPAGEGIVGDDEVAKSKEGGCTSARSKRLNLSIAALKQLVPADWQHLRGWSFPTVFPVHLLSIAGDTIAAANPAKRQKTVLAEPQPAAEIDPEEAWSLAVRCAAASGS